MASVPAAALTPLEKAFLLREDWIAKKDPTKILDLCSLGLTELPEDFFKPLRRLKSVWMSHNKLTRLPEKLFADNLDLTCVWMSYNQLTTLPRRLFEYNEELQEVTMKHNCLTSLPDKLFEFTVRLEHVDISRNRLTALPPGFFDTLRTNRLRFFPDFNPWSVSQVWDETTDEWILRMNAVLSKQRILARCKTIKEDLIAAAWNPSRPWGYWLVMNAFQEADD